MTDQHPRPEIEYPRNWHELLDWFPDDEACLRYLERLRWGQGFACRFGGAVDGGWWQMRDGLRRCAVCRSETSVTAGTIFAGTRTPLVSWFAAIWYVVNQKQGVAPAAVPICSRSGSALFVGALVTLVTTALSSPMFLCDQLPTSCAAPFFF